MNNKFKVIEVFHNKLDKKDVEKLDKILKQGCNSKNMSENGSAEVYSFDKDKVIRIGRTWDMGSYEGYHPWISKVVINSQKSSVVPKVYYHAVVEDDYEDKFPITVMERLKHKKEAHEICESFCCSDMRFKNYYGYFDSKEKKNLQRRLNFIMMKSDKIGVLCEDMHGGNLMFRKDGSPVITDPSA